MKTTTKQKPKHSAGPWERLRSDHQRESHAFIDAKDGAFVASVNMQGPTGEAEANARLIAAAPEMLEALQTLVDWLEESGEAKTPVAGVGAFRTQPVEYEVVTKAKDAILKSRGWIKQRKPKV